MTRKLLLGLLLATPVLALTGADRAVAGPLPVDDPACIVYAPGDYLPPYCPVSETWDDFGPEEPECDLDDPRAPRCAPGDQATFTFQAVNPADPRAAVNLCTVKLEGVTPSDAYASGYVRFRSRLHCDRNLRSATIESRLVNANQQTEAFSATASCTGCGQAPVDSLGARGDLGNEAYELITTVRLELQEGQGEDPPDPWVVVVGAPPDNQSNGTCVPGGLVTKCKLVLPVKSTTL